MRRPVADTGDMPGQDSFLDVVANMVGILIILVMIVGVRARNSPAEASPNEPLEPPVNKEVLVPLVAEARDLERDAARLSSESQQLKIDIAGRTAQRDRMALLAAAMEDELAKQREKLDSASQVDFDLKRQMAAARQQLEALQQQRAAVEQTAPLQVKVQSLPTPITKTVHGKELHFQVRGGRVVHVPLDELMESMMETARHKIWKLEDQGLMTDTIGPIGGFRLRYELGRFEIPPEVARKTGRGGTRIQLVQFELLPVTLELGETAEEALAPGSAFLQAIDGKEPGRYTITLWTYPDSFDTFRRLKAHLHGAGFAAAARPLPTMDHPIGGSPEGTRSAAQ